jgi:hypothetical protein
MLGANLRPKVVPHDGSRLLLGLIVRPRRRSVAPAASPVVLAQQDRPRPALLCDSEVLTLAILSQ